MHKDIKMDQQDNMLQRKLLQIPTGNICLWYRIWTFF